MAIEDFAPAKLNLALHVTGRRDDGYHLLDSLVVFAGIGDRLRVAPSDRLSLRVCGPEQAGLSAGDDNLVLRAARAFGTERGAEITLEKILPVASGIGGGSADAAAALRALSRHWNLPLPDARTVLALGADVPVCLAGQPARMRGIGADLAPLPPLPQGLSVVLANPRVAVSTPAVFRALDRADNPGMEALPAHFASADDFARWLDRQRNDLEPAALGLAPAIGDVLNAIRGEGALIARMSGSGATCFGLFADEPAARRARRALGAAHPGWWVAAAAIRPVKPS